MKLFKLPISLMVLIFALMVIPGMATASAPPMVPQEPVSGPAPASSGGGGSSYTPPSFVPYTIELNSGDGATTGSIKGIDFFTARLEAVGQGTVNGKNSSVTALADLNGRPVDATFSISIGSEGVLPGGVDSLKSLSSAVITCGSGWSFKSGTASIRFAVPSAQAESGPDAKYYVVYFDGSNYQFIAAKTATDNGVTIIEAAIPSITGTFTAVASGSPRPSPTPVPTPAPTPAPTAVPTPTPAPEQSGFMGMLTSLWASTFGIFAIGEAAGAVILLVTGRLFK